MRAAARASRWLTPSFSLSIRTRLRATTSPVSLLRALYTCLGHRAGGKRPLRICIPRKLARASLARYTTPALTRKSPLQLDSQQRTRRCRQTSSPSAAFVPPTFRPSHRSTVQPQAPRPEAPAGKAPPQPVPARKGAPPSSHGKTRFMFTNTDRKNASDKSSHVCENGNA